MMFGTRPPKKRPPGALCRPFQKNQKTPFAARKPPLFCPCSLPFSGFSGEGLQALQVGDTRKPPENPTRKPPLQPENPPFSGGH